MRMFYNESSSLIFNGNEQILSTCGNTISSWLFIHFCYTWFVTSQVLFAPVLLASILTDTLWTWNRHNQQQQQVEDFSIFERDYSRSAEIRQYFFHEIRLTFTYVSFALLFTLLVNHRPIHVIKIFHWLIEATLIPMTLLFILGVYFDRIDDYIIDLNCRLTSLLVYMLKGTLFLWMRYSEYYPSSILNDVQTLFFYAFCNKSQLHRMPVDHFLRNSFYRLEKSLTSR